MGVDKNTMEKKVVSKRVIKLTEYTYEDGSKMIVPKVDDWNDFEIIGVLAYYKEVFQINMMRSNSEKKPSTQTNK